MLYVPGSDERVMCEEFVLSEDCGDEVMIRDFLIVK